MEIILAITIGVLYTVAIYLVLRRNIVKLILGVIFLGNATNLLLFVAGGVTPGNPPFISKDSSVPPADIADPLPQALILTAIVIGFAVIAFTLALTYKYYHITGTEDLDEIKETDKTE